MMDSLFTSMAPKPLADKLRPKNLFDFVGQEKVIGKNSYLRRMIENDSIPSIIFYGPPGTGKTTLAKVIAELTGSIFESINAVSSGVPELRKLLASAVERQRAGIGRTIIFIDEIHRFNKAQQDVLLPYVENMLNSRRDAIKQVNEMFGTDIIVDLNSSWKLEHENFLALSKDIEKVETEQTTETKETEEKKETSEKEEKEEKEET